MTAVEKSDPICRNGRTTEPILGRDYKRPNKRTEYIENRFGLCIRSNETIERNKATMRIRLNRWKI